MTNRAVTRLFLCVLLLTASAPAIGQEGSWNAETYCDRYPEKCGAGAEADDSFRQQQRLQWWLAQELQELIQKQRQEPVGPQPTAQYPLDPDTSGMTEHEAARYLCDWATHFRLRSPAGDRKCRKDADRAEEQRRQDAAGSTGTTTNFPSITFVK